MKFLLVGFDSLRPEMVTEELMPNLFRFQEFGVKVENFRCCFPSETYVNLPSLVTGTTPARHGIIANRVLDRNVDPREHFVKDHDLGLIKAIGQVLMELDCCGMVFSSGSNEVEGVVPGSFSKRLVMADHPRSPDIYYVLRTDNEPDRHGYIGNCYFDSDLPVGGGIHGGLHPKEMHNTCVAGGSFFRECTSIPTRSGVVDVLPTILHGLGLPIPDNTDGRILFEALAGGDQLAPVDKPEEFETGVGRFRQILQRSRIGDSCYIEGGWRRD